MSVNNRMTLYRAKQGNQLKSACITLHVFSDEQFNEFTWQNWNRSLKGTDLSLQTTGQPHSRSERTEYCKCQKSDRSHVVL